MSTTTDTNAVTGSVRSLLRAEGLAVFAAATLLYFMSGGIWWVYALLLFAPDLSFFGYAGGNKVGAAIYNFAHTYIMPILLAGAGILFQIEFLTQLALIYFAHIGLDRSLGYGLKYETSFKHTHLGTLAGRQKS